MLPSVTRRAFFAMFLLTGLLTGTAVFAQDVPEKDKFCHNRVVTANLSTSGECVSTCNSPGVVFPEGTGTDPACFNGLVCCYIPGDPSNSGGQSLDPCAQAGVDSSARIPATCIPASDEERCAASPLDANTSLCAEDSICCVLRSDVEGGGEAVTGAQAGKPITLPDPLGGVTVPAFFGNVIRVFSSVAGAIALLMFVYGGIMWILSGGESAKVQAAQKILMNSTIGLVLIFGAYLFVSAILSSLLGASAVPTP